MTNNSPNPVDGDVQALIGLCKIEVKRWKAASETSPNMRYMVTLMETALEALTAEPGIFEWRFKETDCAPATGWIAVPMERLEQAKKTFGDLVEYRFWFPAPPAQPLRPVDLSQCKKLWYDHDDLSAEIVCIPVKEIKKALRQQGYEVKE